MPKKKKAKKKTVWVLHTDTDSGRASEVYATEALAEQVYITTVNEFYDARNDKRHGPDAKNYDQAKAKADAAVDYGSMDFVSLEECEIEGYEHPDIVIYVEGGNVQGVSATEPMEVSLVDFDNLKAGGMTSKECSTILKVATRGMVGVF